MSGKKIAVALVIILVATGGFIAGLLLLRQRQDLREEAAVPTGDAKVSIDPTSGNYEVGDTIQTSISFDSVNIAINGVAVRLKYAFSGATPEVSVSSVDINPTILSSSDWNCPTKSTNIQSGEVVVDVACANISSSGFITNGNMLLANVTLTVDSAPALGSVTVRFDPQESIITQKSTGEDILLIPASTGNYVIDGGVVTTATPTTKLTGTVTPTTKTTLTPTKALTTTPTPTGAQLPDAGVSYPTYLGIGLGILVVVGSMLLAL